VELYLHSPNIPSWCGAQLKEAQGQLYLYLLGLNRRARINFRQEQGFFFSLCPDWLWGPPVELTNIHLLPR
jgi:hypothetical protein